ncbi:MAG: hypothetical protein HUU01_16145 [Saprospiraceae bacterium]|nr:hypothetical protein [Saprospiraceae bacterium]
MPLHLNIEDFLSARTVESDRIEFKEGWNPDEGFRSLPMTLTTLAAN